MARMHAFILLVTAMACSPALLHAGPPWRTDDPEPVGYGHWELYVASQGDFTTDDISMTAPHVEVNYGVVPEVQLHVIFPMGLEKAAHAFARFGYADMEAGAKIRFVDEGDAMPQVGAFPIVVLPTSASVLAAGDRTAQVFLPLWLQKRWGAWQTYGGGGCRVHPRHSDDNTWFFGWQVQRDLGEALTCGVELTHETASRAGAARSTAAALGAVLNLTEHHHILASLGRTLGGAPSVSAYLGWQLTIGD